MQKGMVPLSVFAGYVDEVLGRRDWVPGIPGNKAAATPADVATFVRERSPAHVHLLGIGPRGRSVRAYLEPFSGDGAPTVSLDSNWITANVGRGGTPRIYTAARDQARRLLGAIATTALVDELALRICFGGAVQTSLFGGA